MHHKIKYIVTGILFLTAAAFHNHAYSQHAKCAVGVNASVDRAYRNWYASSNPRTPFIPGYTGGLSFLRNFSFMDLGTGFNFSKRVYISRLERSDLIFQDASAPRPPSNVPLFSNTTTVTSIYNIEVPVKVTFKKCMENLQFLAGIGTAYTCALHAENTTITGFEDGSVHKAKKVVWNSPELGWSKRFEASLGIQFFVSENSFIRVEPVYRAFIPSLSPDNVYQRISNLGGSISLNVATYLVLNREQKK